MKVTLIGLGCGDAGTMTTHAREALARAEAILGAKRLLESLPEAGARRFAEVRPEAIRDLLKEGPWEDACVVLSGDTGFYSGAKKLIPLLEEAQMAVEVIPGVSSLQYFAAKLHATWQDWRLCSAHGVEVDPVAEVCRGQEVFFPHRRRHNPRRTVPPADGGGAGGIAGGGGRKPRLSPGTNPSGNGPGTGRGGFRPPQCDAGGGTAPAPAEPSGHPG